MFLPDQTIGRYIDEGKILITPEFDKDDIRSAGVRLHLAKDILVPEPGQTVEITGGQELKYREVDLLKEEFYLEPNGFVLAATYEAIHTPRNVLAILDGRSTVARLGLTTHITASVIDGTFEAPNVAVLEIKNVGNFRIRLKFRDPIAMMIFAELKEDVSHKPQFQYQAGQSKVTPPNLAFKTGHDRFGFDTGYELVQVQTPEDWEAYHRIRREELFEAHGRFGDYDANHPDEKNPENLPLLLKWRGHGVGTTCLDLRGDGTAIVRLVAVTKAEQRKGHGRVMAWLVEDVARAHGVSKLLVNAAVSALGYYEKLGYVKADWGSTDVASASMPTLQMTKELPSL